MAHRLGDFRDDILIDFGCWSRLGKRRTSRNKERGKNKWAAKNTRHGLAPIA
jgi:hypothetical protein